MNLVPTASTTAALALGDALAMTLLVRKGFREEDFANLHPGDILENGSSGCRGSCRPETTFRRLTRPPRWLMS